MNPNISKGIFQCISNLRENHEFEDFQVTVEGDIYSCHSLILASCSKFFAGLLRSNMKEKQEMKVEINIISSPIFQLVLNSIYTGCELLTKENVLDVWSAVHQLQIQFLIEHCEEFILANLSLDTVELYKQHAEYLQSEKVCDAIFNFILKNFGLLRGKEIFLRLDFQYLLKLLKSDQLEVSSEDIVLLSIFDWVNYRDIGKMKFDVTKAARAKKSRDDLLSTVHDIVSIQNIEKSNNPNMNSIREKPRMDSILCKEDSIERKFSLIELLKSSRYCLASEDGILRLFKDKLIQSDIMVQEILFEILTFKCSNCWHGHWPTSAIHRDCSNLEHVAVFCDAEKIGALSFKQDKMFHIQNVPKNNGVKLTIFKGKLYIFSRWFIYNEIYVLESNKLKRVSLGLRNIHMLLAHEKNIYGFDNIKKDVTRFNPESSPIKFESFKLEIQNPAYVISFHNTIIVFSSLHKNGVNETAVSSWNTETHVWTKLNNLNFSSLGMTSFHEDRDTYILDSNGSLWKLTDSAIVGFTFITKMWNGHYNVIGAFLFRETLFLFHDSPYDVDVSDKVDGVFSSRRIRKLAGKTSNFVHHVISTKELKPD